MENALYDFYSLVDTYHKTHSFATQLVNKNRTRAFSMKHSLNVHEQKEAPSLRHNVFRFPYKYR